MLQRTGEFTLSVSYTFWLLPNDFFLCFSTQLIYKSYIPYYLCIYLVGTCKCVYTVFYKSECFLSHHIHPDTLESFCPDAMFACSDPKTKCVVWVRNMLIYKGKKAKSVSRIIKQDRTRSQGNDQVGTSSEEEPVLDSHP